MIFTLVLWVAVWFHFTKIHTIVIMWVLLTALVWLAWIDARTQLLPNVITYSLLIAASLRNLSLTQNNKRFAK